MLAEVSLLVIVFSVAKENEIKYLLQMIRKAFVMSIDEGQEAEYEKRHNPIWKELEILLKEHGAHNYSIFLHEETRQLFGYVEIEDQAQWEAIAKTEGCLKWWSYMGDIMKTNEDLSPTSIGLREVFHLD